VYYFNGKYLKLNNKLHGNGWDRLGYADIIHQNGEIENVTPYDKDDFVDREEVTWGAVGINSVSRHIALEGGIHPSNWRMWGTWKFEELYTNAQFVSLSAYLKQAILDYPWIKIIGHRDVPNANKMCPNTNILQLCRDIGIKENNIGLIV
jgi:N-acetyl-anhydromuramyl-L-alanine amidase AmpD